MTKISTLNPTSSNLIDSLWMENFGKTYLLKASPLALGGISTLLFMIDLAFTPPVRRICPGRYTADSSLWVAIVSILFAFNITKARNEHGEEIDFEPTFTYGVTS